jgi:hypothetical protein
LNSAGELIKYFWLNHGKLLIDLRQLLALCIATDFAYMLFTGEALTDNLFPAQGRPFWLLARQSHNTFSLAR